jgi:hypothetical protein
MFMQASRRHSQATWSRYDRLAWTRVAVGGVRRLCRSPTASASPVRDPDASGRPRTPAAAGRDAVGASPTYTGSYCRSTTQTISQNLSDLFASYDSGARPIVVDSSTAVVAPQRGCRSSRSHRRDARAGFQQARRGEVCSGKVRWWGTVRKHFDPARLRKSRHGETAGGAGPSHCRRAVSAMRQ